MLRGSSRELFGQFVDTIPELGAYALTFLALGVYWVGNRVQFERLERADLPIAWLTLGQLALTSLTPWSAVMLGENGPEQFCVVLYAVVLTLVGVLHGLTWLYASRHPHLFTDGRPPQRPMLVAVAFVPSAGYAVAALVALVAPSAGMIICVVVPLVFASGLFYFLVERLEASSERH